ncbi:MAG: iron-sulfur cluster carrier protein ApbC [Pseudomonadota bacterium]
MAVVADRSTVEALLAGFVDPLTGESLTDAGALSGLALDGDKLAVQIELGYPAKGIQEQLGTDIENHLKASGSFSAVAVEVTSRVVAHKVQGELTPLPEVKNVIAVASGKGGVGKSTTSVNLALALAAEGATVGLLDADIYGPSQPRMVGASGKPESDDGHTIEPKMSHGLQTMSIGYLIDEDTPMVWRGPMVTQALQQLISDTRWKGLDYLIIDMPPGTGDIQLTLAQRVPVSGAVIVTTPQDIALLDAKKGLRMFEKVSVPVLGIVENMSTHVCSNCGHEEPIFGEGGGASMAEQYNVKLLGQLPLDIRIRQQTDSGNPTVVAEPDGALAQSYREIARQTAAQLSVQARNKKVQFPNIVIKDT